MNTFELAEELSGLRDRIIGSMEEVHGPEIANEVAESMIWHLTNSIGAAMGIACMSLHSQPTMAGAINPDLFKRIADSGMTLDNLRSATDIANSMALISAEKANEIKWMVCMLAGPLLVSDVTPEKAWEIARGNHEFFDATMKIKSKRLYVPLEKLGKL